MDGWVDCPYLKVFLHTVMMFLQSCIVCRFKQNMAVADDADARSLLDQTDIIEVSYLLN